MAFDGLFTHAMVKELMNTLKTGRVAKIYQPYQGELVLTIRVNRKNKALLLSSHPNYARAQITEQTLTNPSTPSNFVMSLRKHLDGAILKDITQVENDRIINLHFAHRNDIGDEEDLILSVEIMGRRSNIVLHSSTTGKIIDTIKHISSDQNRYRMLVPGAQYLTPPAQDLLNPFVADAEKMMELQNKYPNYEVLAQAIRTTFQGFGKETALELAYEMVNAKDSLKTIQDYLAKFDQPTGFIYDNKAGKLTFAAVKPQLDVNENNVHQYASLSETLDQYYYEKVQRDRVQQRGHVLIRVVRNELKKNRKKLKKLQQTMNQTKLADTYRVKGEILTTYLHQIERGMTEIELPNFYDENKLIKISLSNQLSPSKNAQKYFTKYQKEKNAVRYVSEQIAKTESEINFLDNIETQIDLAKPEDLDDIKLELENEGYLKKQVNPKKRIKPTKSKSERFEASDHTTILVGKNDTQNDRLTMKTAKKDFYWLHAKDIPGSHVIIESNQPSEKTIEEAATIAAYYSKARNSANVAVDYVQVRNIRKPNGSKPGFVIYEGQKTIKVTPSLEAIRPFMI
ncbi:NFACT RNA binding domain-containing protein [Pediococcus pentosaceus]|uniref:NFACT RNA binding domain-containing protein n=1 Tax=Pediococcus pentosaceus TaxID=1255 RepID=UPI00211BBDB3|nr:NFACT RNA binding domain-containing protein [Pediococcus pentosaceus]MCQ9315215.1 NFACT RNA binding domain-containing protein [Pediococcus pentosaceus]MCQ9337727.1 NFACT RNA binding domain-containing protein [Pediococcus pentosaceus]